MGAPGPSPVAALRGRALDGAIWGMAWPVVVALMLENAADLVDIAMVGHLGTRAQAAVGYSAQLAHFASTVIQAVAAATVALMARAVGSGRRTEGRAALAGGLIVAALTAGVPALAVVLAPSVVLGWLGAPADVVSAATPYLRLVLIATCVSVVPLLLESGLRAERDTRRPLAVAIAAVCVKVLLNLVLMFGLLGAPRLELLGAGIATLGAQLVAATAFVRLARRRDGAEHALWPHLQRALDLGPTLARTWRVALPAIGERVLMNLALLSYFAIVGHYGATAIAAYAIGVRVLAFSWLPSLGFGAAAATLVGQALGEREPRAARRAGWRAMTLSSASMLGLAALCLFLRGHLALVFTRDPATLDQLTPFLVMLAVAQPFMGVHFSLAGALRGAGDTRTPLFGAAVGNWLLRVPIAWAASRLLGAPLVWAWAALVADHVLRAAWYATAFYRARWTHTEPLPRVA